VSCEGEDFDEAERETLNMLFDKSCENYLLAVEKGWKSAIHAIGTSYYFSPVERLPLLCQLGGEELNKFVSEMHFVQTSGEHYEDIDEICFHIGYSFYRHQMEVSIDNDADIAFAVSCFEYFCACIELLRRAVVAAMLSWKKVTGIRGPGSLIGKKIWDGRVQVAWKLLPFDQAVQNRAGGKEPQAKKLKVLKE
jgi:hypothetical protein